MLPRFAGGLAGRKRLIAATVAGYGFQQGIEIFQTGIFDDHSPAAILILDGDLQAEGPL